MVAIEKILDESTAAVVDNDDDNDDVNVSEEVAPPLVPPTTTATPATTTPSSSSTPEGWTELMGKDLLMKTLEPAAPVSGESTVAVGIQHQDVVLVDFVGRACASACAAAGAERDGPIFIEAKDWWVVVGDKDVLPCLELGIRFAHVGETVAIWSHSKYAYGMGTRLFKKKHSNNNNNNEYYELPPNSNVLFHVTILQRRTATVQDHSTENTLSWVLTLCECKKNVANDAYANEWSKNGEGKARILYLYEKVAKEVAQFLDTYQPPQPQPPKGDDNNDTSAETTETTLQQQQQHQLDLERVKMLLVDCLNNIVAVHLRAKEYHAAKEAAVRVLQRDPTNFKALIRAAKAALLDPASSYEEVEAALQAAAENARDGGGTVDNDLQQLRADFKRRKQAYQQKSKQMYSKALGGSGSTTTPNSGERNNTENNNNNNAQNSLDDGTKQEEESENETAPAPYSSSQENAEKPFSWSDRSTWPWYTIMAYVFQLLLPFIMWQMSQYMREEQRRKNPNSLDPFLVLQQMHQQQRSRAATVTTMTTQEDGIPTTTTLLGEEEPEF